MRSEAGYETECMCVWEGGYSKLRGLEESENSVCNTKGDLEGWDAEQRVRCRERRGSEVQSIYSLGDQFLKTAQGDACCSDSTDKGQWELEGEIF